MAHEVTLIPGDGIGPEVTEAARRVLAATGVAIEWDVQPVGAAAEAKTGSALPAAALESVRRTGVALKGPVATRAGAGARSANLLLRDALGLHTNVRPARTLAGVAAPLGPVDVAVARMTAGDLYAGVEFAASSPAARALRELAATEGWRIPADAGLGVKPISRADTERAAAATLGWARANGRSKVTIVHKATVMRATDGLFLEAARAVAAGFPDLDVDDRLVDAVCHDLVRRPDDLDVLFCPMLYGDLLSDLCAGLTGGLGVAPGVNLGEDCAVFEAVHGTAPHRAGRGVANPLALIRCGALLLDHLGERDAARRVEQAVGEVVREGDTVTYDLRPGREPGGAASTRQVAEAVAARVGG